MHNFVLSISYYVNYVAVINTSKLCIGAPKRGQMFVEYWFLIWKKKLSDVCNFEEAYRFIVPLLVFCKPYLLGL